MDGDKHYVKYTSKEERLQAWRLNRAEYSKWRRTPEAYRFISWKRDKQRGLCFICIKPLAESIHIDHIFPLYLGGTNFRGNMCLTHPKCNMDKGIEVYQTYKQACHRRRQFNLMAKASRARERLRVNPSIKLSKKDTRAIRIVNKMFPVG